MTNSPMKKRDWQELSNLHLTAEQEYFFSQTVIDSIHGSFYMLDADGKLVRWNAFLRDEISGKPEQQMAGTNVLDFFHPDDRLLITEKIRLNLLCIFCNGRTRATFWIFQTNFFDWCFPKFSKKI